ncbi:MAG: lytic transglycosylase [Pseudomonadales bacterium]|nr:lytic transglycosylase [Pseudomonadales bacterium]RLU04192.1 MAG: LysM peptidoglycan-binding domain-containing protein [Ketobacter sp.]
MLRIEVLKLKSFVIRIAVNILCLILISACSVNSPQSGDVITYETEPAPLLADQPEAAEPEDYSGPDFFIPGVFDELATGTDSDDTTGDAPTVWEVYRKHTILDLSEDNTRIKQQRDWYAKHQSYLDRVTQRAEPYLYYIIEESIKRGLPSELALLPVVESAYDPFAYSHGRAAGIWQFIPGTGRAFGLKQTWWYEGRRDIVAATDAAMDYLESLNRQFDGDWMLALASYNSGAGTVRNAIKRNQRKGKPTDFWSLDLPKETRAYVPKLIAISQLFAEPEKYGITLIDYPYQPFFEAIDIGGQLDLAMAAKMADLPMEELYRLNPAFNRWATDPKGPHRILVPVGKADQMRAEIDKLPMEKRVAWARYTIQRGDSILSISKKHNITPDLLKQVNHLSSNNIRAGKTLLIPQSSEPLDHYSLSAEQRLASKQNRSVSGKQKVMHKVKNGETFWSISRQYGVHHRTLAKWNGMAPTDTLSVGKTLVIWTNQAQPTSEMQSQRMRKIRYRARSGDSYAGIANRFNVSLGQLRRWNDIDIKKYLQPGDMLTLYVDVANAP